MPPHAIKRGPRGFSLYLCPCSSASSQTRELSVVASLPFAPSLVAAVHPLPWSAWSPCLKLLLSALAASRRCHCAIQKQGLLFRGRDESGHSTNQGNFLELLKFLTEKNENVNCVAFKNTPENLKLTSLDIQKNIVNSAAIETTNAILAELGDGLFSILIDESRDVSIKEQMEVILRYVNKERCVVERFLGIKHVTNIVALSLKKAVGDLFSTHNLSISRVREQGYDGASNMQ